MIQRHLEHALIGSGEQGAGRSLEPQTLDEAEERLARDSPEDTVEMKRRKRRDSGQLRERKLLGEVGVDMIDNPV